MKKLLSNDVKLFRGAFLAAMAFLAAGCAQVDVPGSRSVNVPTATPPLDRFRGLNEERDAITRVKLGKDVLVPIPMHKDPLPEEIVGPYELRGETLASTLQLLTDDYDVSLAFESDRAMTQRISVANLKGKLSDVVDRVCELADLYCSYRDGVLTVKDMETFIVDLPPLAAAVSSTGSSSSSSSGYDQISSGLEAIIGKEATVDSTTRVMIYSATQKAQKTALKYFERLRKNTALIVYETHIWEVTLDNNNRTGINWQGLLEGKGIFDFDVNLNGAAPTGAASPITITPTYTGSDFLTASAVLEFISEQGAVKTVSQPQLTVISGSSASLQVQQSENFVSGVQRTPSTTPGVADTVSTTTQTINTGLTMSVASAWDQATVYGTINIGLDDLLSIDEFNPDVNTTIQLPKTTKRGLQTQVRVRPGDSILIGGLVSEKNNFSSTGPGFMEPVLSTGRAAKTTATELVFLLRPRVVTFVPGDDSDTPQVSDAPKEGFRPDTAVSVQPASAAATISADAPAENAEINSPLPEGISAEALAPQGVQEEKPMTDEEAPTYQPEQKPEMPVPNAKVADDAADNMTPAQEMPPQSLLPDSWFPERVDKTSSSSEEEKR